MKRLHFIVIITAWAILILVSLWWNISSIRKNTLLLAENKGQGFFDEIETTRLWNAKHGGVYVPINEETQPNPYLNIPNRDVETNAGQKLTKVNPAFMSRQIADISETRNDIRYHITSLKPIRPENKADNWETIALKEFDKNIPKKLSLVKNDSTFAFRFMAPLFVKNECLKCHEKQGYKVGDIRGGISITMSANVFMDSQTIQERNVYLMHGIILFIGIFGLWKYRVHSNKNVNRLEMVNTQLQHQKDELKSTNKVLFDTSEAVETQQFKILEQYEELHVTNEKLNDTLEIVNQQKSEIQVAHTHIQDSINYANRIQTAVLPSEKLFEEIFPEHFIVFKPRDIVSGDFYWIQKVNKHILIAAADCTGHGVPGAFMSMLGISFLNEIVIKHEVQQANQVLEELRNKIKTTLDQTGKKCESKDGMDIAFCGINTETYELQYAGAYTPMYIVRNNDLIEYKANRQPIGIYVKEKPFTNHTFQLQKGDKLYIFSDGYIDQFGGEKERKFLSNRFKKLILSVQAKNMHEQKQILEQTFIDWKGDHKQLDDVLVMGIKI